MTDRELLELAAKAAGLLIDDGVKIGSGHLFITQGGTSYFWNPLTDDGDALRLAVKIGQRDYFGLEVQPTCVQADILETWEFCAYEEYKTQDPLAATRRAIVRAAAEIAKAEGEKA